jgi:hypothetical protein
MPIEARQWDRTELALRTDPTDPAPITRSPASLLPITLGNMRTKSNTGQPSITVEIFCA